MKAHYLIHHLKPLNLYKRCFPRGIHPVGLLTIQPTDLTLTKTWLEGNKASNYNPKGQMFQSQVEFLSLIPVWESIPDCSICTFLQGLMFPHSCGNKPLQYKLSAVHQYPGRSAEHAQLGLKVHVPFGWLFPHTPVHHHLWSNILADISSKQAKPGVINNQYLITLFPLSACPQYLKIQC